MSAADVSCLLGFFFSAALLTLPRWTGQAHQHVPFFPLPASPQQAGLTWTPKNVFCHRCTTCPAQQPESPLLVRHVWLVRPMLVVRRWRPRVLPPSVVILHSHHFLPHPCRRGRRRRVRPSRRRGPTRRAASTLAARPLGHVPRHDALARKVRAAQPTHKWPQPLVPRRAVAGEVPLVRKPRVAAGAAIRLEALVHGAGVGRQPRPRRKRHATQAAGKGLGGARHLGRSPRRQRRVGSRPAVPTGRRRPPRRGARRRGGQATGGRRGTICPRPPVTGGHVIPAGRHGERPRA